MRYQLDDIVLDTDKAKRSWEEATYWNGSNHISKATGDQWVHETLYLSAKDRYYIVRTSQWQGSRDAVRLVDQREATRWLLANEHDLPEALAAFREEVEE